MIDPLNVHGVHGAGPVGPVQKPPAPAGLEAGQGKSFQDVLLSSLEQVNQLQQEAADGVEKVMTGETENIAEVFSAVRKAEVAFGLLMEMRNKMLDAYQEVQQMRV